MRQILKTAFKILHNYNNKESKLIFYFLSFYPNEIDWDIVFESWTCSLCRGICITHKKNYGNSLVTSLIDNNCFNADVFVQVLFLLTASCFLTLDGLTKVLYLHNYWFPQHVSTALFLGISINPPEAKFNSLDESIHANSKTMQMLGYFEEKAKKNL